MRYYLNIPRFDDGLDSYYVDQAELERARQWNVAKAYMQNPSLPNIFNAIGAAWNALPFNTNARTINPYVQGGIAPVPGKVSYTPEQMAKYWMKLGAEHATRMKFKTVMGPNGKMYADVGSGKLRSFESIGKEILGGDVVQYTPKPFKPVKKTKKITGPSIFNKPNRGRIYNTNAYTANDVE